MFFSYIVPYKRLNNFKCDSIRQRQRYYKLGECAWIVGMLFICLLIMSLMIVKVSSAASFYQNRKTPTLTANNIYRHNQTLADPTTTALAVAATHQPQLIAATEFIPARLLPIKAPKHHKLRQNIIMREAFHQQQQYMQQLQHAQQQHAKAMQLQQLSHAITGETAYLLERADNSNNNNNNNDINGNSNSNNAHEQPIYGTWLTKAKRPQPSLVGAAEAAELVASTVATAEASLQGDAGDNITDLNYHHNHHHYERLPRRAATMTPSQSELHDQLPRPPRIVSRHPSMLRRQLVRIDSHAPIDRDDQQPKPFHFPHEGPMPHEFTKLQSHPEQDRSEINNIQDILKQLHIGGMQTKPPPQLIMMPTGLHVAGSFKNFKSSGIANFFRNKRHKKHLQLALPMQVPMHWVPNYQPQTMQAYAPHQRIAMDQFYPFKPRSPNDINLLAMQQQLQTSSSRSKSKKKRKHPIVQHASPPLLLQHSNQRPFASAAIDPFMQSYPQYMFALNQSQKSKTKRIPFKLNLDIYPVATPTKDYKASAFTLEEAKLAATVRPATALRNPFAEYYPFPPAPASVNAIPYNGGARENIMFNGLSFPPSFNAKPTQMEIPQSSGSAISYNQHSNPFYQNLSQQQHQQQQVPFSFPNQQSNFVTPVDNLPSLSQSQASSSNAQSNNSNQLLLHLNVFPKQNSISSSTNPFYTNVGGGTNNNQPNINRQATEDQPLSQPLTQQQFQASPVPKIKPRCKNANKNAAAAQKIARSDNHDRIQPLIDFEHPIVAAEVPNLQTSTENYLNRSEDSSSTQQYNSHREQRGIFKNINGSSNMDQMAVDARTASLFRFPVEDLIQFQVDDAL